MGAIAGRGSSQASEGPTPTNESDESLRILFVSAEVAPYAKVGGLADVAGSLPKALHALGHDVRVIMPCYGGIDRQRFELGQTLERFNVHLPDRDEPAGLLRAEMDGGAPVYFVESERFFARDAIYGHPDDGERFLFFCRAVLEAVRRMGWSPDVLHSNDWHTGIIPSLLRVTSEGDRFFAGTATVFTIHNLAYQGIFDQELVAEMGLDERSIPPVVDRPGLVNLMSLGILNADMVNTVSPTYAKEILTPEYGEGLDSLLRHRQARLVGILNGLDTDVLDPAADPYLAARYDVKNLDRKTQCKLALQRESGMPGDPAVPLVGVVSRLADQKGFDLLEPMAESLLEDVGVQWVLLGTGDKHYEDVFRQVANRYPGQMAAFLAFDAALAQRIYGGADMFLMPSRYEPCGLGQMIAMRYGTVPVVHRTGGLADTVVDYQPATGVGNGFSFDNYTVHACLAAVVRAVEAFRRPVEWQKLQRLGMAADFSWSASARHYVELYRKARQQRLED